METETWWEQAHNVALVRIDSVGVGFQPPFSAGPCVKGEPCVQRQVGKFALIETFKGSLGETPILSSGYGSGDCGIPLVAGAFYVVFLNGTDGEIGFCNAAGPYPMRNANGGIYPIQIEPFVVSLRKAARNPKLKVAPRPKPMTYDSLGGV